MDPIHYIAILLIHVHVPGYVHDMYFSLINLPYLPNILSCSNIFFINVLAVKLVALINQVRRTQSGHLTIGRRPSF